MALSEMTDKRFLRSKRKDRILSEAAFLILVGWDILSIEEREDKRRELIQRWEDEK